jgi:hypothetical protein
MTHIPPDLGANGPAALVRLVRDAEFRGNVVARQVCEPLEELYERGQLTAAQLHAGQRLRHALTGSWPEARVSMRWGYVSDASEYDDDGEPVSEEEAWARRGEAHALWRAAEASIGRECWPWVQGVCRGFRLGSQGRGDLVRRGLDVLVREWKL